MKRTHIKDYLDRIGVSLNDISLGEFDYIGEFTAKKARDRNSPLFRSVGMYFRPNYERGILIHSMIAKFKLESYLEIGFGRGFSAVCAAKALYDIGSPGKVVTVDPIVDEKHMQMMSQVFPKEWLQKIEFHKGTSAEVLPGLLQKEGRRFDFVYVDGDHRAPAVQADWDMVKGSWDKFCLFDDYHYPDKKEADIECAQVIDAIDWSSENCDEPECVILDRRIFLDDRGISDTDMNYGQVVCARKGTYVGDELW